MSARIVRTFVAVLVCVTSEATLFARRTASKASRPSASPAQAQKTPASSPDYSKEAAVIEQIREQHWYENDGSSREVQYVRVRIQAEAAVQAWGQPGHRQINVIFRRQLEFPAVRVVADLAEI
jgi:hypothetical protein